MAIASSADMLGHPGPFLSEQESGGGRQEITAKRGDIFAKHFQCPGEACDQSSYST